MKKITKIFFTFNIIIMAIILSVTQFYSNEYRNNELEEIIFYLKTGLSGADLSILGEFFREKTLHIIITIFIVFIPILLLKKLKIKAKELISLCYSIVLLGGVLIYSYYNIGFNDYVTAMAAESDFIKSEYVDTENIEIKFPEEKRNLIILFLESMETTMISKEKSGGWDYTVIPELEEIAENNINFSNTENLGGATRAIGSTWTIGGLVGLTSGLPLKTPAGGNDYKSDNFLGGATTLGDILKEEGYNLKFMFGSDATYGGRRHYLTKHGEYEIFDLLTAIERGYMTEEEKVFWGYEDGDLFEWAKEELLELAGRGGPFTFNLLTVNTHFPDGWVEEGDEDIYPTQYENVHAASSKQIGEFVNWVQEQDFYENTTIVLVGDHTSMQEADYYLDKIDSENFERVTYNAFINAVEEPKKEKNRVFSNYDIFPTILSSIGAEFEGNKLGVGVDLFSEEETIFEKYGVEYVNEELKKSSEFYNEKFLQIYD